MNRIKYYCLIIINIVFCLSLCFIIIAEINRMLIAPIIPSVGLIDVIYVITITVMIARFDRLFWFVVIAKITLTFKDDIPIRFLSLFLILNSLVCIVTMSIALYYLIIWLKNKIRMGYYERFNVVD